MQDSSTVEQSHTSSSLRKECLDGGKETEDVGMGTDPHLRAEREKIALPKNYSSGG